MMACIHSGQAAFARNFIGITGMAVGLGAGVVTFGGIIAGSTGLMMAGGILGTTSTGINMTGHVIDGNTGAAIAEVPLWLIPGASYQTVRSSARLTNVEKLYLNAKIFKISGIGNFAINATNR